MLMIYIQNAGRLKIGGLNSREGRNSYQKNEVFASKYVISYKQRIFKQFK